MAKVLVTGAAGVLGSYLVQELLDRGHEVVGLDDHSKYGPVSHSFDGHPRYRKVEGDARDTGLLRKLLDGCEHLIAGAAMVGGVSYVHTHAYDVLATNERIMAATCDAAITAHREGQLAKVTYLSSSTVYESADRWPSREGDELRMPPPASSSGFQTLAVEYWARAAYAQYGLPYTIVRPFGCVGIGEVRALGQAEVLSGTVKLALSHVVSDLVHKVLKGQDPLHILGDGSQVRHFTYAGDLARGIVLAMEHPLAYNEDFNLASSTPTTVLQLAERIWHRIRGPHEPLRYVCDEPYPHDVARRIPDVTKAREILGFEATTTVDEILDELIPWVAEAIASGRL